MRILIQLDRVYKVISNVACNAVRVTTTWNRDHLQCEIITVQGLPVLMCEVRRVAKGVSCIRIVGELGLFCRLREVRVHGLLLVIELQTTNSPTGLL